jgi:hypothetical protein
MWDPQPDLEAAAALGEHLRDVGYDGDAIEDLLGEDGIAADLGDSVPYALRLDDDDVGNVIRLLLLNRPVPASRFPGAREAARLGLVVENDGMLVPRARIVPTEGIYLTFDTFSHGEDDPAGWVASFSPTTY